MLNRKAARFRFRLLLSSTYILVVLSPAFGAEPDLGPSVGLGEIARTRLLLRAETPQYVNYAHQPFVNYPQPRPSLRGPSSGLFRCHGQSPH